MREMQVKHGAICHEISCILISLLEKLPPERRRDANLDCNVSP